MLLIITLFILAIYQAQSATINFEATLATPNLELECTYTLEKNEVLYRVILKKDSETFVQFEDNNKNKPQFTKVDGVTNVTLHGAGKVTINNYVDSTWGIYSCNVYYDMKDNKKTNSNLKSKGKELKGTQSVSKKMKLKMKSSKCIANWKTYTGSLPNDRWVAVINNDKNQQVFCRVKSGDDLVPGYLLSDGKGNDNCVYTYNSVVTHEPRNYEILCGTGFEFVEKGQDYPTNSHLAGNDAQGRTFIGKCDIEGYTYLGKVNDKFYTAYNDGEWGDCTQIYIVLCAG